MYHYWGVGLTIASEIEFPELLPWEFTGLADLTISLGTTPERLPDEDTEHTPLVSINPTQYLLKLPNICNYFAANGNCIIVEPLGESDDRSLRLFLLNSVMAALLYQRNNVILHSSGVEFEDGVALFCGTANSGKSTLAAGMLQRGYKFFCDDMCLVRSPAPGRFEAIPSYPLYQLWEDSFIKLNQNVPCEDFRIRPNLGKYTTFYHTQFDISAKPIKRVYILRRGTQRNYTGINKLNPVDGFTWLHNNNFYRGQINPMKKQALSFLLLTKSVNFIPVYDIKWCDGENSIDEICTSIERSLQRYE
jgi:hypothetical protein